MECQFRRSELSNHRLITYGTGKPSPLSDTNWILTTGQKKNTKPRKPTCQQLIDLYGLLVAVETGAGSCSTT